LNIFVGHDNAADFAFAIRFGGEIEKGHYTKSWTLETFHGLSVPV
jgi:hypothetical protein